MIYIYIYNLMIIIIIIIIIGLLLTCIFPTSFYKVTVKRVYLIIVLLLWDVWTVQMSTRRLLVHYPQHNAAGVNTSTTIPIIILAFDVMHVLQDLTVQQGKSSPLSRKLVHHKLALYLAHQDYLVLHTVQLNARVPALHNVHLAVENSHLVRDVIYARQEHTRMERC